MKNFNGYNRLELLKRLLTVLVVGFFTATALNLFLIPAHVMSAGMSGVAQILIYVTQKYIGIKLNTGFVFLLLNIPIFVLGLLHLGKEAMKWSFANVISITLFTIFIPQKIIINNILMNALVGGVLIGVCVGSLKLGFTTGGMDIISCVLSKTSGKTVGKYMFVLNAVIVMLTGLFFSWESALYTIICIYCMSYVIDMIHTNYQKITVFITTSKLEYVKEKIVETTYRGMTIIPSVGGYSGAESNIIMIVITRYELYDLRQAIIDSDPEAFVNVIPTHSVFGKFASGEEPYTAQDRKLYTPKVKKLF